MKLPLDQHISVNFYVFARVFGPHYNLYFFLVLKFYNQIIFMVYVVDKGEGYGMVDIFIFLCIDTLDFVYEFQQLHLFIYFYC